MGLTTGLKAQRRQLGLFGHVIQGENGVEMGLNGVQMAFKWV